MSSHERGEDPSAYREAGVDVVAGRDFVRRITRAVQSTHSAQVLPNFGSFAGLFDISFVREYRRPLLVSGTDGVGTKLHVASLLDRHEGVGIDLVAMCANDVLACGAKPLFFLDYIATGKLDPARMATVVESIAVGCRQAGASLIGGETAEHPGLMRPEDYDLAGFLVGVVEADEVITGRHIRPGDAVIALPSSGVHSNGMSLVRRLFLKDGLHLPDSAEDVRFLAEEILRPTIIYEPFVRPLLGPASPILGLAHITGGGFFENIPRVLPEGVAVELERAALPLPPLFERIQKRGALDAMEMYGIFNMGVGLVLVCRRESVDLVLEHLRMLEESPGLGVQGSVRVIGRVVPRTAAEPAVLFRG